MNFKYFLLSFFIFVFGCHGSEVPPLFTDLNTIDTGVDFQNTVTNSPDFNIFTYRNYYNGGGVAIGDINNDNLQDVYFTSNMGENKLYLNLGNFKFKDISLTAGVTDSNRWSTGVSFVDINDDGFLDIYVCNAGYRTGYDSKNSLFINNGDLTFTERAAEYNLDDDGYTTHAVFFDFDRDNDLDVYILNNSFIPVNTLNYSNNRTLRAKDWPVKDFLKGGGDKLMRNDNGRFTDVSEEANIYGSLIGFGLGVTVGDVNGDYWPDIYVSNDFFERDYLYINRKDGTFSEELEKRFDHISMSSMGADMADINNDCKPEIFVTDMLPDDEKRLKTTTTFDNINLQNLRVKNGFYHQNMQNTLQFNDGSGRFNEISHYAGVSSTDWSWGALMFDADMDTYNDIFVCNGIYHDVIDQDFIDYFANEVISDMAINGKKEQLDSVINKMPSNPVSNFIFRNNKDLTFTDESEQWGFGKKTFSNGSAYGDLDNDGDYDLIINNVNQEALIYRNESVQTLKRNFIGFDLRQDKTNVRSIGTQVIIHAGKKTLYKELIPNRGFQSSVDMRLLFSLDTLNYLDSIEIFWSDGKRQVLENIALNKYHLIKKSIDSRQVVEIESGHTMFKEVGNKLYKHNEDMNYLDFLFERNIPWMLSKEGPALAIGDVNGDDLKDVYLGGGRNQAGQLYINTGKELKFKQQDVFDKFAEWEDTEAVFFDMDNDRDLDLYVGSGGNFAESYSRELHDRIYVNDGKGNFSFSPGRLPANGFNSSSVSVFDFENDGDLDLFVGSRSYPLNYGIIPKSFVFVNDGKGYFKDLMETRKDLDFLKYCGMVTDSRMIDVDGDKVEELLVVGEWMAPKCFKMKGKTFFEMDISLNKYRGLWQAIQSADIDKDGDQDLILGNIGANNYLTKEKYLPLKMVINDFDGNNTVEKILVRTVEGSNKTVMMKRDITDQLTMLKKKNLMHKEYATKTFEELFGAKPEDLQYRYTNTTRSVIAFNDGKGAFTVVSLPTEIQFSSVRSICVDDVNDDGYDDLILVGNTPSLLPQFGHIDASKGMLLYNNKKNGFDFVNSKNSGLYVKGYCSNIGRIEIDNRPSYIVARNNTTPYIFEKNAN